jgi:Protein of unknown function (DUF2806)
MDLKISDLTGLKEPITRLIEVVSTGVGKVAAPYLIASTAGAKAKEILRVAQAIKSVTNNADLDISYDEGKVAIKTLESHTFVTEATTIENRASDRILFEATKQQRRLERVTSQAALELSSEQSVPDEKPDEDWIARFFDYAKNISSEQMQSLWGKILAGEIKQPGSFAVRTLDILRNISQQESELFVEVAQYAFYSPFDVFVPNNINAFTDNKVSHRQLVALAEIGLLQQSNGAIDPFRDGGVSSVFAFSDDVAVKVTKDPVHKPRVAVGLHVWIFTRPARNLAQFFPWNNPPGYVDFFCKEVRKLGWVPTIGTYTDPKTLEFCETPQP